ncbi:MAG: helix-turn-helix transcriptional regulator [Chitinophagales bacterium]
MKINISIIKGILKSLLNNDIDIHKYSFLDTEDLFAPKKINEQLIDAHMLLKLITEIRSEYDSLKEYYPLFKDMHVLDMGLLGHYLLSCKNIFTSYEKLIEYQLLFSNFVEFKYKRADQDILWSVQMPYQIYREKYDMESLSDFELFFRFKIVETLSTTKVFPKKIELFYNKNNSKERIDFFRDTFNCEVVYTKSHNVLHYGISDLNKDIHYQNYNLYVNLKPLMNKSMTELYSEKTYKNTIKSILLNNVDLFPLPVLFVANKLHMSTRKLQTILKNEETSFSQIVNDVKVILGIEYLKSGKNVKEIAARLGYREQGSFTRQFKQVTNINPVDFMSLSGEEKSALIAKLSS